jgi:hypothetical protein
MKIIIFIFLISVGVYFNSSAQKSVIPYYDAKFIRDNCLNSINKFKSIENLTKVLHNYYPSINTDDSIIKVLLNNNPFLSPFLPTGGIAQSLLPTSYTGYSLSSIGGFDVTNFADGIAKFIVERMKAELSVAFFNRFKETLNDSRYSDLKILYPQTWRTLMTIDQDIYQYSSYLNILRESFIKDMTNQYINLQNLLNQQKYKEYFLRKQPELGSILFSSLYFINQLSSGMHPGDVLAKYNPDILINLCISSVGCAPEKQDAQTSLRATIHAIQLLSASFRSQSNTNYWVSADSVRKLVEDTVTFKIYLGLIYQQILRKPIIFSGGVTLISFLDNLAKYYDSGKDSIDRYRDFIETFIDNSQEVNEYLVALKSKMKSEIDYNDYYKLFNASLGLLDHSRTFIDLPYVDLDKKLEEKVKSISNNILYVSRTSGELYIDVRTKNYSSAILNTISVLDNLLNYNYSFNKNQIESNFNAEFKALESFLNKDKSLKSKKNRKEILLQVVKLDITSFNDTNVNWTTIKPYFDQIPLSVEIQSKIVDIVKIRINLETASNKDQVRKYILKYGSFIANVAQAQNSDEVQAAIESAVLPVGSSSIKRETDFNISLNSFIGPYGGVEYLPKLKQNQWAFTTGLTAPVGVAFSWGNFGKGKKRCNGSVSGGKSFTIFIPVIDIGSMASFRMGNDSSKVASEVTLSNIISPGLFFYYGFGKCPISIGLGGQLGPQLRDVTARNINIDENYYIRFGFNIVVDIPFFNLYTKN